MPRRPRLVVPGQPLHVVIRGINREPIFYADADYRCYLGHLKQALEKYGCQLHAYVLMTNHVHLLLTPPDENSLSKTIQSLGRCYVQYFNHTYKRTGTLWEGWYKSALVDTETYLLKCYRYIELNPERAQMVVHPAEYPWSSYRVNALGQENPILAPHHKYIELGKDKGARLIAYQALFKGHISEYDLQAIREMTNKEWVLGSEYFREKISKKLNRQVRPKPRGGDRRSASFRRNVH